MKLFGCKVCQQTVFFESVQCTRCGQALAYLPDQGIVCAIEWTESPPAIIEAPGPGSSSPPRPRNPPASWRAVGDDSSRLYRMCKNQIDHAVCNWGVPLGDPNDFCLACRLNHVIPSLATNEAKLAWRALEAAKRRVLYTLYELGLPVEGKDQRPDGLQFDFLQEGTAPDHPKVYTGHNEGVITINAAEADDPFREKMRVQLGEAYRTVLGHFRHEIGHYYWDRLVKGSPKLPAFRELFGDESVNYAESQKRHYSQGAPANWVSNFVSAYASMHPWEDWAETWAHYLHIVDTLETAAAYGLSLRPIKESANAKEPTQDREPAKPKEPAALATGRLNLHSFHDLIEGWIPLTVALNSLNRSMGLKDGYPFVLSDMAIEKLKFVHGIVESTGQGDPPRS